MDPHTAEAVRFFGALKEAGMPDNFPEIICEALEAQKRSKVTPPEASVSRNELFDTRAFTPRTSNLLMMWKLSTLGLLQLASEADLFAVEGISSKRVGEVREYLSGLGLRLRGKNEPLLDRAREIYGSINDAPSDLLALQIRQFPALHTSPLEYYQQLVKETGIETIGDFAGQTWLPLSKLLGRDLVARLDGWLRAMGICLARK